MNEALRVTCASETSGFRNPLAQSVQDTFPLPPPTTIVGMAGAAMGVPRAAMVDLYTYLDVAVVGTHETTYQDLTRIVKFKGGKVKEDEPRSLLVRENLRNCMFLLWLIPQKPITVEALYAAFKDPKYALSLGRDDEIVRVEEVSKVKLQEAKNPIVENTVLPFPLDPRNDKVLNPDGPVIPLVAVKLPRRFEIHEDLIRYPIDIRDYTFTEHYQIQCSRPGAYTDGEHSFYAL